MSILQQSPKTRTWMGVTKSLRTGGYRRYFGSLRRSMEANLKESMSFESFESFALLGLGGL